MAAVLAWCQANDVDAAKAAEADPPPYLADPLVAKPRVVRVEVWPGTLRDAILFAAGANDRHGLRRSREDKRRAVETLLADAEWAAWSDREIARRCAVSHPLVAAVRKDFLRRVPTPPAGKIPEPVRLNVRVLSAAGDDAHLETFPDTSPAAADDRTCTRGASTFKIHTDGINRGRRRSAPVLARLREAWRQHVSYLWRQATREDRQTFLREIEHDDK
jgi:hypothetical protein